MTVRDMARLDAMRVQVRRSDRLSSLGTLAAGLAHELNNPVAGILGLAQLQPSLVAHLIIDGPVCASSWAALVASFADGSYAVPPNSCSMKKSSSVEKYDERRSKVPQWHTSALNSPLGALPFSQLLVKPPYDAPRPTTRLPTR